MYNCGSVAAVDVPSFTFATEGECAMFCDNEDDLACSFIARYAESLLTGASLEGNPPG